MPLEYCDMVPQFAIVCDGALNVAHEAFVVRVMYRVTRSSGEHLVPKMWAYLRHRSLRRHASIVVCLVAL